MDTRLPRVYVVRHGATPWTRSKRHTGRTDLPLLPEGEVEAAALAHRLVGIDYMLVLRSPLVRAVQTCQLAGFGSRAEDDPDLMEWDFGLYEGLTTTEIREQRPGWYLLRDGCPDGETPEEVGERADRVIARVRAARGNSLLFSHSGFSRVLAARWLGLPASRARFVDLSNAALSVLGYDDIRAGPVLLPWHYLTKPASSSLPDAAGRLYPGASTNPLTQRVEDRPSDHR